MDKTTSKTIKINHDTLVNILASNLYALSIIDDSVDIIDIDLGLAVDENGLVEIDLTLMNDLPDEGHPYTPPSQLELNLNA